MTSAPGRAKSVHYTASLFQLPAAMITKNSLPYTTPDSMKGKKVGAVVGQVWGSYLQASLGGDVQLFLGKKPRRPKNFVPAVSAGRNQHDDHAAVRQQPHARMLQNSLAQRRSNNDAHAFGNLGKNVGRPLGNF